MSRPSPLRLVLSLLVFALFACAPSRAHAQDAARAPIVDPPEFIAVSVGTRHSCALASDGRTFCWGADWYGQLGAGGVDSRCDGSRDAKGACSRTPVQVGEDLRLAQVHAGDGHTCGIDFGGVVWCWGDGSSGQFGRTDALQQCVRDPSRKRDNPMVVPCSRHPVRVPMPAAAIAIDGGEKVTCAVDADGAAWCWHGAGDHPERIPLDRRLASIAVGDDMMCGLTDERGIRCWNLYDLARKRVQAPTPSIGWAHLDVGAAHACAIDDGGLASCWGRDRDGALGIGGNPHDRWNQLPLTPVLGEHRFGRIATGAATTCATDSGDRLWCWGRVPESAERPNDRCLDSNGSWSTRDCTSHPVRVHPTLRFRAIAVGRTHGCGVTSEGALVCWGDNEAGQLGDGTLRASLSPVAVRMRAVTPSETRRLDAYDTMRTFLTNGGLALLLAFALLLVARGRVAKWELPNFGALTLAALVLYALVVAATARRGAGAQALVRTTKFQLLSFVATLCLYRLACVARARWDARPAAAGAPLGTTRPPMQHALRKEPRGRGMIALVTVLAGWALLGWARSIPEKVTPHDEVSGGIGVLFLVVAVGVALALACIGGTIGALRLRRNRDDKAAIVACVLGALTFAAATGGWGWLIFP